MATPWPVTLQEFFSEENFQLEWDGAVLESDMDTGPKKRRRRQTRGIDVMSASIFMTTAQYNILETFYKTTLAGGVLPFTFDHPVTGVATDFRFMGKPSIRSLGGGQFSVAFQLEVLP